MYKGIALLVVVLFIFSEPAFARSLIANKAKVRKAVVANANVAKGMAVRKAPTAVKPAAVMGKSSWKTTQATVSNWVERKYDVNGDGYLQTAESKKLLNDRYAEMRSIPNPAVKSSVEKQYDTNNDNILQGQELAAIANDI